jgi:hypothetical protein
VDRKIVKRDVAETDELRMTPGAASVAEIDGDITT